MNSSTPSKNQYGHKRQKSLLILPKNYIDQESVRINSSSKKRKNSSTDFIHNSIKSEQSNQYLSSKSLDDNRINKINSDLDSINFDNYNKVKKVLFEKDEYDEEKYNKLKESKCICCIIF